MSRHVLHVVPALAPRYGGPSAAALGMCRALSTLGASTLIAATDADGKSRLLVRLGEAHDFEGVPAIFFRRTASESFKWSPDLARWLRSSVDEFDVVHVHAVFSHASLAAGRACRRAEVPYLVRPLGTLDPWSLSHHRVRKRLMLPLGVRRLLERADAIHYTSEEEQRLAEGELPWLPRGLVVPLGVDDEWFAPDDGALHTGGAPRLLVLARLDVKKGIDLVIAAFHAVAGDERCRDWMLVIAGDGDPSYVSHLKELAQAGDARKRIEFRGWVSGDERATLMRRASLFALPSHQENFGIAVVEAMACGVPVVVSPGVNLATDIESASAGWVTTREPIALRETLRAAMANRVELQRRGRSARTLAERFRWSHVGGGLLRLYDDVLGARAGAAGLAEPRYAGSESAAKS